MRLTEYLQESGESQAGFARRAGLPQTTVNVICQGRGIHVNTAIKIIRATGGAVSLEDLSPTEDDEARAAS